ncbi:hypothetical protein V6Z11_D08G286000 [Gossypium hirsutum]
MRENIRSPMAATITRNLSRKKNQYNNTSFSFIFSITKEISIISTKKAQIKLKLRKEKLRSSLTKKKPNQMMRNFLEKMQICVLRICKTLVSVPSRAGDQSTAFPYSFLFAPLPFVSSASFF